MRRHLLSLLLFKVRILRFFIAILCLGVLPLNPALATGDSDKLDPPRSVIGWGVGFTGLVHIDYQRWMADYTSFEVGLTPLVLHNVVAVAVTQHINIAQSATNLVLSGMWMQIVNMGGIAGGPGVRVGVEHMNQRFGVSLAGGPATAIGGEFHGDLLGDARLTFWKVK